MSRPATSTRALPPACCARRLVRAAPCTLSACSSRRRARRRAVRAAQRAFPPAAPHVSAAGADAVYPPTPQPSLAAAPPASIPTPTRRSAPRRSTCPTPRRPRSLGARRTPPRRRRRAYGTPYPRRPRRPPAARCSQNMPSPQWSNGATYNYQNPDGTVARLQRFLQQISVEHTYLYGNHDAGRPGDQSHRTRRDVRRADFLQPQHAAADHAGLRVQLARRPHRPRRRPAAARVRRLSRHRLVSAVHADGSAPTSACAPACGPTFTR